MRFDHVGIKTTDLEASLAFYTGVLGFEKTYEVEVMGSPCVFLARGGVEIELETIGAAAQPPAGPATAGLNHLSFKVDDIDAVAAELTARGGEFLIPPFQIRPTRKTGFMKAPDGVLVQLIQDVDAG